MFALVSLFAVIIFVLTYLAKVNSEIFSGPFVAIDGDSLVLGEERFRLEGIDAPELYQTCLRHGVEWPCGRRATGYLRKMVASPDTRCKSVGLDKYARYLVRCQRGELDVNEEMVRNGWAVSYGDYLGAQERAKAEQVGIWEGKFEAPREWRETHGSVEAQANAGVFASWFLRFKTWVFQFTAQYWE